MNFPKRNWLVRCMSRVLPATKSDMQRLEQEMSKANDDMTAAVTRIKKQNDALLTLLQNAANNDGLSAAEAQAAIDALNAESDKDNTATGADAAAPAQ